MKKLAALLCVALGACATLPTVTPAQLARAQQQDPSLKSEDLESGRKLFVARCGNCHNHPSPTDYAPAQWPHEMEEMAERSHLSADQAAQITRFLQVVSQP